VAHGKLSRIDLSHNNGREISRNPKKRRPLKRKTRNDAEGGLKRKVGKQNQIRGTGKSNCGRPWYGIKNDNKKSAGVVRGAHPYVFAIKKDGWKDSGEFVKPRQKLRVGER